MSVKPLHCQDCGTVSVVASTEECPHCNSKYSLTITEDDPRFLVFFTMAERIGRIEGIRKIDPTEREVAILNHGDQLYFKSGIIRIVAKTYGRQGRDPFFWVQRFYSPSHYEEDAESSRCRLHTLPPAIPGHVLNQIPREQAREAYTFPISQDRGSGELLILCRDEEHFNEVCGDLPDLNLNYWLCDSLLIRQGLRYFYSTAEVNCRAGLEYECPLSWEYLTQTDSVDVRFCEQCEERVYLVRDSEQRKFHSKKGHCVALNPNGMGKRELRLGIFNREPFEND